MQKKLNLTEHQLVVFSRVPNLAEAMNDAIYPRDPKDYLFGNLLFGTQKKPGILVIQLKV